MYVTTPRTRGVTLRYLDLTHAVPASSGTPLMRYAAVTHLDTLYVICSEGVGWSVTDYSPLEVQTDRFRIVTLSPDEVRSSLDTEVDLSDLIRTFGDRLESNYWLWFHTLTE